MFHVQCNSCGVWTLVRGDIDFHTAVTAAGCKCCEEDHHHGENANSCHGADAGHVIGDRTLQCSEVSPEERLMVGCTVCRSITITGMPGTLQVSGVGF